MAKRRLVMLVLGVVVLNDPVPSPIPTTGPQQQSRVEGKPLLQGKPKGLDAGKTTSPQRGTRSAGLKAAIAEPAPLANQDKIVSQCLMITDLAVVNDPRAAQGGKWSFGYLLRSMANTPATGIRAEELARRWLAHWEQDQTINGFTVHKRDAIQAVIDRWPKLEDGRLDLDRAPFRLLAIVNRIDLRNNLVLGAPRLGDGGAGEGRFVYCLIDETGSPLNFTVNFEFAVKRHTFEEVKQWARLWYDLKDLTLGSDEYLQALEAITEQFAAPAIDPEQPPSGSALAQLRTNEIELGALWEMREFQLDTRNSGYLRQVTVKQNPDISLDNSQVLLDWITREQNAILDKRHSIPVEFPTGEPFLAGSSLMRVNFRWTLPDGADPGLEPARSQFALHTCNGCHFAETNTQFVHIVPRRADKASRLSQFLKTPGTGDLALREADLRNLVEQGRSYEEQRLPLQFVH
jgi:hypothetical protein